MTPQELANLAHLRRARDLIDREYAKPLDVPTMAAGALMSAAHFSRQRLPGPRTPRGEGHAVLRRPAAHPALTERAQTEQD